MKRIGYKVMSFKDDGISIRAGADGRLNYKLSDFEKDKEIKMPGNGIYLGIDKEYVLDYYSDLAEKEILLTLEFETKNITTGNINDKEPELSVSTVKVLSSNIIIDGEVQENKNKIAKKSNNRSKKRM